MTQKEIKALTIGITEAGTPALCKTTRNGKPIVVRNITPKECSVICALLFTLYQQVHPDEKVMYLPYEDGTALAITEVEINLAKDSKDTENSQV